MYAQTEKSRQNKNGFIPHSIAQMQNIANRGIGFMDNRTEAAAQTKLKETANNFPVKQPRPTLQASEGAAIQMTKFEFDGLRLDSDDVPAFVNFAATMARVNRERLQNLVPFLLVNSPGLQARDVVWMVRVVWQALGFNPPIPVYTIPAPFLEVLRCLDSVKAEVSRASTVAKTIHVAGLIDANAELIAFAGPNARFFVRYLVGEQPETGFVNESAGAIHERTQVVLHAWRKQTTQLDRIRFFNQGFGSAPCICGRLNGVAEFLARQSDIPEEALSDAKYDVALSQKLAKLAEDFFGGKDPDWPAFMEYIRSNYAGLMGHPKFGGSFQAARDSFIG
jgi:hypothetical protein